MGTQSLVATAVGSESAPWSNNSPAFHGLHESHTLEAMISDEVNLVFSTRIDLIVLLKGGHGRVALAALPTGPFAKPNMTMTIVNCNYCAAYIIPYILAHCNHRAATSEL